MSFYAECDECDWARHGADPRDLSRHEDECPAMEQWITNLENRS